MYINGKLSDFLQAANTRNKVSPGCSLYQDEQPDDPCKDNECQNRAQCTPNEDHRSYKCVCRQGFEGDLCEIKSWLKATTNSRSEAFLTPVL